MEIERKYLVIHEVWRTVRSSVSPIPMRQAYLSYDYGLTIRVRISGDRAFLTIKGPTEGISRDEFEYGIPLADGMQLLSMVATPVVVKDRYKVEYKGFVWEVDEFHGDNEGLIIAEVELKSESDQPEKPNWTGEEVSHDRRYSNLNLALNPYQQWPR
jgi:CYTH domain-containing protein